MDDDDLRNLKFSSYDDLLKFIKEYEAKQYVQLNRTCAKKLTAPCVLQKYPLKIKTANKSLIYYNLTYMCVNGGNYKYTGSHKRKSSTTKMGCQMFMRFRLSPDGKELEMADFNIEHNHLINKEIFHLLPKQRRLNDDEKREAEKFIKLKCNKKMIKHYIKMNTGKTVTLKDLSNLKINSNNFKDKNELIATVDFLKMDPEAVVEVFVNENNELEGLYFQDKHMKKSFESYPEVLLCDATYKLNNLRIPLYILLVINGNGNGEVAATFLLVNENENSLSEMIQYFKKNNCAWEKTISILTDKDLKERNVFKKEFPEANLILCLFHTLKIIQTAVTSQKMHISNEERDKCLKVLQKLAYSNNEQEYQTNYEHFLNLKLTTVINYYNTNWHNIREQWVEGLKRQNLTLNITTTNHLESLNQKIKQVVTKMGDLRSFYGDLMILFETIRDEYKTKAAVLATKKLVHNFEEDSVEAKYINLLTPYAFSFVEKHLNNYNINGKSQEFNATLDDCQCNVRQNMKLPCQHIFYQRALCKANLFDENLVSERYKRANYIVHNTVTNSSDISSISDTISVTKIGKKREVLTNNDKYRKTLDLCQQIASSSSECGRKRYEKLTMQLTKFLNLMKEGKDILVLEDKEIECDFEELTSIKRVPIQENTNNTVERQLEAISILSNAESLDLVQQDYTEHYDGVVGAQVEIHNNKTYDATQSQELNIIPEAGCVQHNNTHNKTMIKDFEEIESEPSAEIIINNVPALDHTYTIRTEFKHNYKINDIKNSVNIENIQYKHLKMKRIGRPKGADNTVIGLKRKRQTDVKRKK